VAVSTGAFLFLPWKSALLACEMVPWKELSTQSRSSREWMPTQWRT